MADKYDAFLDSSDTKYDSFLDTAAPSAPTSAPTSVKESTFFDELNKGTIPERIKAGTILYPEEENAIRGFLHGAASGPISGIVQAGAEAIGAKDVAEKIAKVKKEGNIVGSLFQPEAWLTGRGVWNIGKTAAQKALNMAGYGGIYGATQATEQTGGAGLQERVESGNLTAGVSGAIPIAGRGIAKLTPKATALLDSLMSTFSQGGRASVGHRMVLEQLSPIERDEVLKILQQSGVDVSALGTPLTTAQALGQSRIGQQVQSPSGSRLATLEDYLSRQKGGESLQKQKEGMLGLSRSIMDTLSGGRGARVDPLLGMSADDVAMEIARQQRGSVARKLYPTGDVTGDARLNEIMSRPGVRAAMGIEETSAGNVPRETQIGKDIPAKTNYQNVFTEWQQTPYKEELPAVFAKYSIKSLQNQYRLMDKEITGLFKTGVPTDETRAYELMSAKDDLGKWLSEVSPEWALANKMFAFQSNPLRQMEVGAAMKGKLESSPNAFLKATENIKDQESMIRSATGRPNRQLSDIFNLGQLSKISGLRNQEQILGEVEKLKGMASKDLSQEEIFQLPNLLNVWVAVMNRTLRQAGKATVNDITEEAAKVLANPSAMRNLLLKDAANRAKAKGIPNWISPLSSAAMPVPGMLYGEQQ